MSSQSIVVAEKSVQGINLEDWHSKHNQIRKVGTNYRSEAEHLRSQTRSLRNETDIKANWTTYNNNVRYDDRILELKQWLTAMVKCRDNLNREIEILNDEKTQTEREIDATMTTPLDTVSSSLSTRNNRLRPELTYDKTDEELKAELCVVEKNRNLLKVQCENAWKKLNLLKEVLFKVNLDIENKQEAIEIDEHGLSLDKFCSTIAYKTDPQRAPKNFQTYKGWLEYSKDLKSTAEKELKDAYDLRESLFVCRETCRNSLWAQQDRTDHMIRRRIFETQRCLNELDWQVYKTKEEMEKCWREIQDLEKCYHDKCEKLKLAETRLEYRTTRSGMELCSDETHSGLQDEIMILTNAKHSVMENINKMKVTYNNLHDHINRLKEDLDFKNQSMATDVKCLDGRKQLKNFPVNPVGDTQTGRNIMLTKMEKEIPKEQYL